MLMLCFSLHIQMVTHGPGSYDGIAVEQLTLIINPELPQSCLNTL